MREAQGARRDHGPATGLQPGARQGRTRAACRAGDLQESEQRFRLMAEHAPVMIWMCDAQGRCLHLNQMLRRFWRSRKTDIGSFDWRTLDASATTSIM